VSRLSSTRRRIHADPELGFTEFRTSSHVIERLNSAGWAVLAGQQVMAVDAIRGLPDDVDRTWQDAMSDVGPDPVELMRGGLTGVVGVLSAGEPVIAIRVDLDALPIDESDLPSHRPAAEGFRSGRPGVMHACGHDGHIAVALELAERLARSRPEATVKLVFQPAEEGLRGALPMAESGVLDDVDELLCLHLGLGLPLGTVAASTTGSLASTKLRVRFAGRPAHASLSPELGANALLAACSATLALHSLAQRADGTCRVNVGALTCLGSANVVPARADLLVELRAQHTDQWADLRSRTDAALLGAARMHGVDVVVEETGGAPAVVCDQTLAEVVAALASEVPGVRESLVEVDDPASDDASWLIDRVSSMGGRGTYLVVGADQVDGHHGARFDFDEDALELAVGVLQHVVAGLSRTPRGLT
jgi:aminobenzoyl-glutamate utilization protein A